MARTPSLFLMVTRKSGGPRPKGWMEPSGMTTSNGTDTSAKAFANRPSTLRDDATPDGSAIPRDPGAVVPSLMLRLPSCSAPSAARARLCGLPGLVHHPRRLVRGGLAGVVA